MTKTGTYNVTIIVDHVVKEELIKVIKDVCESVECHLIVYYKQGLDITYVKSVLEKEGFKILFTKEIKQDEKITFGDIAIILSRISNAGKLYDCFKLKNLNVPVIFILK